MQGTTFGEEKMSEDTRVKCLPTNKEKTEVLKMDETKSSQFV